jgi:uncharacterized membrane-anchored protein YjiN (DUF445 family)
VSGLAEGTGGRTAARRASAPPQRSHVGTVSLLAAVSGAVASHTAYVVGPLAGETWLAILGAGFEAATVGALADWFAVTALFRHPLGIPIPHTAIIPTRRAKIIEGIVTMIEEDWLSPEVIGSRLEKVTPSSLIRDWLSDPERVRRLGAPLRGLLRRVARLLTEEEVVALAQRTIQGHVQDLPAGRTAGEWLTRALRGGRADAAFASAAASLAQFAARPRTAAELHWWLDRSARTLRAGGRRFLPMVLRSRLVQRKIVEAACDYAASELGTAARDPQHPLRRLAVDATGRFAERLADGNPEALAFAERVRSSIVESLESGPLVRDALARLRTRLEKELDDPNGPLADLIDRRLRAGVVELLDDPERSAAFDRWVRSTADDLLRRHHHQIGVTVRENLEALETGALVARIEDRVGADLQFIRLNGAVVGGLVGLGIALLRWALG